MAVILAYTFYIAWIGVLAPFPDSIGRDRTPLVLRTAAAIRAMAPGDVYEQAALVEIAMSRDGLFDYALPGFFALPRRPSLAQMEAEASASGRRRLTGYCVGQSLLGAALANELGLTWRAATSTLEGHSWIEVQIQGKWYALNAKSGHPKLPPSKLFSRQDPRLGELGYAGPREAAASGWTNQFRAFNLPPLALVFLLILTRIAQPRALAFWRRQRLGFARSGD